MEHTHIRKKVRGQWVNGCVCVCVCVCVSDKFTESMLLWIHGFVCESVCVCVIDCTAILCAFGGSGSELGRTPWSDGMFRVQQLGVSVQRAAEATRLKTETQNTEIVCCCDSVIVSRACCFSVAVKSNC